jgi:hypothetical protein
MRSVPNSPPILPLNSPLLQDNLDLFPPLPAAYPASYLNTPLQPPPQQQYAHDDEFISYSNRLRKNIDLVSKHQHAEFEGVSKRERQGPVQPLPPHVSPGVSSAKMYRPRSASVSRKPQHAVAASTQQGGGMLSHSASMNTLRPHFVEGNERLSLARKSHSGVNNNNHSNEEDGQHIFESEAETIGDPARMRQHTNDDFKKSLSRGLSEDYDISSQSAYIPLSYAVYAQSLFNYGGIGGIPTPLTREILSFVERVDAFGAKMQRYRSRRVELLLSFLCFFQHVPVVFVIKSFSLYFLYCVCILAFLVLRPLLY